MELAGGLILGVVLMFSLLAFSPTSSQLSDWLNKKIIAFNTAQTASIGQAPPTLPKQLTIKKSLALSSVAFANGSTIPARYTCDGLNVSPTLFISGVPEKTQSLVLMMDDPDAGNTAWVHWLVFNIPPTVREIPEGKEPSGRSGMNSWGKIGYGGPCPPRGKEHRYVFHLYALSRTLPLRVGSSKAEVLKEMKGIIMAEAQLVARYKRIK